MQSKKGFIITGVILGAITIASFAVWMIPQNTQTQFVVTDPKSELDALIEQQKTIADSTTEEFDRMLTGQITPDNYISIAEISSSQVNSFIIKTIDTSIPTEWQNSYSLFGDSLRSYNSYIRETIVIAEKLKADAQADISQEKATLDEYLNDVEKSLSGSNDARPS